MRLGVLVPCRDEAAAIGRKVADLAAARWPAAAGGHQVLVVDDGSVDGTAALALDAAARSPAREDVRFSVVPNRVRPGKPGAVHAGIEALEGRVDLIVLTDADVVIEPGSLEALARAFESDARLAMACGAQRFVRDLAEMPLADASEPFDRWTARVRRLESLFGMLFSVHGQLLAWRAELRLRPRAGIAADDLDLMLQVRARAGPPRRVAIAPGAVFLERKTPAGPERTAQAMRRARAYVQLVRSDPPLPPDALSRLQWAAYRVLPLAAPALTTTVPLAATAIAWLALGAGAGGACLLFFALFFTSRPGWRWAKLAMLIRDAARREAEVPLPERWTVARR
jgi:glycosyltransferase involved in cell wall biosynthesis